MLSRRNLIRNASLLALAPGVPAFLTRVARTAEPSADQRILVVIQLDGGNDGINTVVPFADEGYAANRRELRIPRDQLIRIDDRVGLHPSIREADDLLQDGRLAIIHSVGYPNPDRSHFRSMAIWHTARFDQKFVLEEAVGPRFGWAGLALDGVEHSRGADAILVGDERLPTALRGHRAVVASLAPHEELSVDAPLQPQQYIQSTDANDELRDFVNQTVLDVYVSADELSKATRADTLGRYPDTQLGQRLQLIARLIKSGLSTRIYYAIQPGYDTHAFQLPAHARLLDEFGGAVKSFLDDLSRSQLADQVLVMAFSEFGRRVQENGSSGTDHGTAGPMFIAGTKVHAGLLGDPPSLTDLADGDLKMQVDFRNVLSTVLGGWLAIDPVGALGGRFQNLPLLANEGA